MFPVFDPLLTKDGFCFKTSQIVQIQLEQDSGKSLHDADDGKSLVDLNRCGVGLMELVFCPDLRHGEEAAALVKELCLILETLKTCNARMEFGELRVDANISVRKPDAEFGIRTEVKNLNSVRSVAKSIEFEVERQINVLEQGGQIENETRSFDPALKETVPMRDKEAKQDYRFMPEPNLPPLMLSDNGTSGPKGLVDISKVKSQIPELPYQTRNKLKDTYGLSFLSSCKLVEWPELLQYFLQCVNHNPQNFSEVTDLIFSVIQEDCNNNNFVRALDSNIKPKSLVEVSNMRQSREISYVALREILNIILKGDKRNVREIVEQENFFLTTDFDFIKTFATDIIEANKDLVDKYRKSNNKKKQARVLQSLNKAVNKDPRVDKADMKTFSKIFKGMLEIKE